MKPSPCLSPIHYRDKITGRYRTVPCGHCDACLVNIGRLRTEVLKTSIGKFNYKFFVTLTYKPEFRPYLTLGDDGFTLYHPNDCDYLGEVPHFDIRFLQDDDVLYLDNCLSEFGGVPVLSHSDLINFKKRFRYHFKKISNEKIFIHSVGEYGPSSFLPHFHLLFGTNENISTALFKLCVDKAWSVCTKVESKFVYTSIGRIDVQRVVGDACSPYVAQYLNCTTNLPAVLRFSKWRPFSSKSNGVDFRLLRIHQDKVREVVSNPTYTITEVQSGKSVVKPVPAAYLSRYFPKCKGFTSFTNYELYRLYELSVKYPEPQRAFADFERDYLKEVDWLNILEYKTPFSGLFEHSVLPLTIQQIAVHQLCYFDIDGNEIFDDDIIKRNFMRLWYMSRRVRENARLCDLSIPKYVDKIIDYYHGLEQDKLKRFYEYQEELVNDTYNPWSIPQLFTLYYNTNSSECDVSYYFNLFNVETTLDIRNSSQQRAYSFLCRQILLDTTKTKKRNDYLTSRGLKRKPYVLHLNHRVNIFLKH